MARAATATKPATEQVAEQQESKGEVAVFHAPRLPYHPAVQQRFGVDKGSWKVLVEATFPSAQSVDAVVMALSYCQHRKLDVFKKPVHIVPMWDSKRGGYVETIWPSIAELRTTAARTKQYAGCDEAEFGPMTKKTFTGKVKEKNQWVEKTVEIEFPQWCRITVHRLVGNMVCKFVGPKVVWLETYATIGASDVPNQMWNDRPEGQIEKCAEAAALRRAFPEELGNEYAAEEMEGRRLEVLPPDKEVMVAHRDDGPPRRSDAQASASSPAEANDGVIEGEYTEVTGGAAQEDSGSHVSGDPVDDAADAGNDSMDEDDEKPMAHEVDSSGMSYIQFADAYIKAIQTSKTTRDVMEFASLNQRKLDKLFAGHKESADRVRRAAEEMLKKLRPKNVAGTATIMKEDPISTGTAQRDDGPPRRAAAPAAKSAPSGKSKLVTVDPEEKLKEIKALLAAVTDPNDLEDVWMEKCMPIYDTLDFPADKSAADEMYSINSKRLGMD
jgi:phage recombination protein Bet